jgi:DNA-directed RNA polymerase specialized sigma24 family protein
LGVAVIAGGEEDFEEALARLDSQPRAVAVESALAALPPTQHAAVVGRVVDEREYAALAADAYESEETIRRRVSRGLRFMRARIEEGGA